MTKAELVAKLRDLLAGERSAAAEVEAEEILAELEAKRPRPGRPGVSSGQGNETPAEDDEAAKWRRLIGGSPMSRRVWSPGPLSGHTKALVRDSFNPWR